MIFQRVFDSSSSLFFSQITMTKILILTIVVLIFQTPQAYADIKRVSVNSSGSAGNNSGVYSSISSDGRYVAFDSAANNLVSSDNNGNHDIFVHDQDTGQTERVSINSNGDEGDRLSLNPSISANGRYVAFESIAGNLVVGENPSQRTHIYVHDRSTGLTERVSINSNGDEASSSSDSPSISGDGRYVVFNSRASNLVAGDTNGTFDVFVHDRDTGETKLVSVSSTGTQGNAPSSSQSISNDGRYVAFSSSASNIVAGDTNGQNDIFVRNLVTELTTRVSVSSSGGQANAGAHEPSISNDGRYVAFNSSASNLIPDDNDVVSDIFVHDRVTGQTERVSIGFQHNNENLLTNSSQARISGDGRFVAFESKSNLVIGDVFLHDRNTGDTILISDGSPLNTALRNWFPSISADGQVIAFKSGGQFFTYSASENSNPVITSVSTISIVQNNLSVVTLTGTDPDGDTLSFSISGGVDQSQFSIDEPKQLSFQNAPIFNNPVDENSDNIYEVEITASDGKGGATVQQMLISIRESQNQLPVANDDDVTTSVNTTSSPINVLLNDTDPENDTLSVINHTNPAHGDIIQTGNTFVFIPENGFIGGDSFDYTISDGSSNSDIGRVNITVTEETGNSIELVDIGSTGDDRSIISGNNRYVAFLSHLRLVPEDTFSSGIDAYVYDRYTGTIERISISSEGVEGNADSSVGQAIYSNGTSSLAISENGRFIAFESLASNLVPQDNNRSRSNFGEINGGGDIFVRDRQTGATERVNISSTGAEASVGSNSFAPSISADGRFVSFISEADNLATGDTHDGIDIFVHDRQTHTTEIINSGAINRNSFTPDISEDGLFVVYQNSANGIIVHDRDSGQSTRVDTNSSGVVANGFSGDPKISSDGRYITYESDASNLLDSGDNNSNRDIFIYDRSTETTSLVSVNSSGIGGNGFSSRPNISGDGRFVAFKSGSTNLVPENELDGNPPIFIHDRNTGITKIVSFASSSVAWGGSHIAFSPYISNDGEHVVYTAGNSHFVYITSPNNALPVFTSPSTVTVLSNTTAVLNLSATDGDGDTLTYRISGGKDQTLNSFTTVNRFSIDATGQLAFLSAPDFSNPTDRNRDNIYEVEVAAADGRGGITTQQIFVTVASLNNLSPSANDDSVVTAFQTTSDNINVLENDTDPENDTLSVSAHTEPSNGAVTQTDNIFVYAPNDSFSGTDSFTYTISDGNNNTASATVNITVESFVDTVPPQITAPEDRIIEASGATTTVTNVELGAPTVTDANDPSPVVTHSATGALVLGLHTITWTATDSSENSATDTQIVSIIDTTAPTVTSPASKSVTATGASTAVALGTAIATDLVDGTIASVTPNESGPFSVGTHVITWTATDAAGNSGTDTQTVTVQDPGAPTLTAPSNVTVEATGATTPVDLGTVTGEDVIDGILTAVVTPVGPYTVGAHTLTWTVTNSRQQNSSVTQLITVEDTTGPVVTPPENQTIEATGETTVVDIGVATATDLVDGAIATVTADKTSPFAVGVHTITWTAVDALGNTGVATQSVTVTQQPDPPNTDPVITSASTVSLGDNVTTVITITSSDTDGDVVTYTISGGADASLFTINTAGELSFVTPSDFASPSDADGNNIYLVEITAADGQGGSSVQLLSVTVTNDSAEELQLVSLNCPEKSGAGNTFKCTVNYTTSDNNPVTVGLGFKLHFDSSKLQFNGFSNTLSTNLLAQDGQPQEDFDNLDGDSSTDKFLNTAWVSTNTDWPGGSLPTPLYQVSFTLNENLNAEDATALRLSSNVSSDLNYGFHGVPKTITAAPAFSWDIDGNGNTSFTSDGIMVIRYLFGFRGEQLISGVTSDTATRDAAAIEQYLTDNLALLDIDGDGEAKPLTDGLMLVRYLAGFTGDTLINGAVNSAGTRTTAEEIENYLGTFLEN